VTSGGLAESPGVTGVSRPISASEKASEAWTSSRTAAKYLKRDESRVTVQTATGMGRGRQPAKTVGKRKASRMSKGGKVEQFRE